MDKKALNKSIHTKIDQKENSIFEDKRFQQKYPEGKL